MSATSRLTSTRRIITLLFHLCQNGMTIKAMSELGECSIKTARRDLDAIQAVGVPVYEDQNTVRLPPSERVAYHMEGETILYNIDKDWAKYFIKYLPKP